MTGQQMASDDDEPMPLEDFTLPDTIAVTRPALDLAERFQAAVPAGWIVTFYWADGRRSKVNKDAPWVNEGPGLDLSAYRIGQIPEEAICHAGSFRYAVSIRKDVIERHTKKTIDLDERGRSILR